MSCGNDWLQAIDIYLRINKYISCWALIFVLMKTLVVWTVHYKPKDLDTPASVIFAGKKLVDLVVSSEQSYPSFLDHI